MFESRLESSEESFIVPVPGPTCRDCSLIEGTQVTLICSQSLKNGYWNWRLRDMRRDVQRRREDGVWVEAGQWWVQMRDADEGCRRHGKTWCPVKPSKATACLLIGMPCVQVLLKCFMKNDLAPLDKGEICASHLETGGDNCSEPVT